MVDMVKKFLKYREKLSTLIHYAIEYDGEVAKEAFKIIEQWKSGEIKYSSALRKIKNLKRKTEH